MANRRLTWMPGFAELKGAGDGVRLAVNIQYGTVMSNRLERMCKAAVLVL